MARKLENRYTFTPGAAGVGTVTINALYNLNELLMITNVTDNIVIYNFSDTTRGGAISQSRSTTSPQTVITLDFDTSSMDSADELQIYVEQHQITFRPEERFIDPVSKIRVSQPNTLIDTDFEYGLQATKWETLELVNNIPGFYSRSGDTPLIIERVTGTAGSRTLTVNARSHGLTKGTPLDVRGLRQATLEGSYLVSLIIDIDTFTFVARTTAENTGVLSGPYTTIVPGKFYAGSDINYTTIETDGLTPSNITVSTDYVSGFSTDTEFYLVDTLGTTSLSFDSATSVNFVDTDTISQTFNPNGGGSAFTSASRVVDPWDFVSVLNTRFFYAGSGGNVAANGRSITITSHGFTGNTTAVALIAGPNSTVPTGLFDARGYFVKVIDANTIALSANNGGVDVQMTTNTGSGIISIFRGYGVSAVNANDQLTLAGLNTTFNGTGITTSTPLLWFTSNATSGLQTTSGSIFAKSLPTHLYSGVTGTVVYWRGQTYNTISTTAGGGGANIDITGTALSVQTVVVPITTNANGNSLFIPDHGFLNNEPFLYSTGGGTTIGGLTNSTTYFIDLISSTQFGLKPTVGGARINLTNYAATGTTHSLAYDRPRANANTISISTHGLADGDLVVYDTGSGTEIGGLTDDATYYVVNATTDTFRLSTDQDGTPIDLTSAGVGTQTFVQSQVGTFDGSYLVSNVPTPTEFNLESNFTVPLIVKSFESTAIFAGNSTVKLDGHRLVTGSNVQYNQGTGTAPTGLTSGEYYNIIRVNKDRIQFAGNLENSLNGTFITLSDSGTGTDHSITSKNLAGEVSGQGTVSITSGSTLVTGAGTQFLRTVKSGDIIVIDTNLVALEFVIDAVLGDTSLQLVTAPVVSGSGLTYLLKTRLYIKAGAFTLHRPFDGGVEINAGFRADTQIVRQTRRYFRYQSGKGMQSSFAINFNPPIDLQSLSAVDTVAIATTRKVHGLRVGQGFRIRDAEVQSGDNFFNGNFVVQSIVDEQTFTYQLQGTPNVATAEGFPQLIVTEWGGVRLRAGMYDFQNGMFFEYDGTTVYAVRRSSTQQLAGTVSVTNRSNKVVGTDTKFIGQVVVDDYIVIRGQTYRITEVDSNSSMTIQPAYRGLTTDEVIVTITREARVAQENWSLDPCDGSGPSRYVLDATRIQMVYMDYAWYGAGKVRFGFKGVEGEVFYAHEFKHNNRENEAYLRSGNLPARYEILNLGSPLFAPSLAHWGTSVIMDGQFEDDDAYLFTAPSKFLTYSGSSATVTGEAGGTYVYVNASGVSGNVASTQSNIAWTAGGTVNTSNERITINSHGLSSGTLVKYNVNGGTLVGGLTNNTFYFLNRIDANTIRLATTQAGALNGTTIVNLTSQGSGAQTLQHTFTFVPTLTTVPGYGNRIIHRFTTTNTGFAAIGNVPFGTPITAASIASRGTAFVYRVQAAITPANGAIVEFFFADEIPYIATTSTNGPLGTTGFIAAGTSQAISHTVGSAGSIPSLAPLISIRLSPSVDSGLTGRLGERDVINRMQMSLRSVGASTTHDIELRLVLNAQLNNNNWVAAGIPSLAQILVHNDADTITQGVNIFNFRASGNSPTATGLRTANTFSADISTILALGNAILGGNGAFPDGPDILTLAAVPLSTSGITVNSPFSVSGRITWSESQA